MSLFYVDLNEAIEVNKPIRIFIIKFQTNQNGESVKIQKRS